MLEVSIDVFPMIWEGGSVYPVVLAEHRELAITAPADVKVGPKLSIFRILGNSTELILGRFWDSPMVVDTRPCSPPIPMLVEFWMLSVGCPSLRPLESLRISSVSDKLGSKMHSVSGN